MRGRTAIRRTRRAWSLAPSTVRSRQRCWRGATRCAPATELGGRRGSARDLDLDLVQVLVPRRTEDLDPVAVALPGHHAGVVDLDQPGHRHRRPEVLPRLEAVLAQDLELAAGVV